ncbi:hypothetical protein ACFQ0B_60320 [Nonomuraea thailandensis]
MTFAVMGMLVLLNYGASIMTVAPTRPYEPVLGDYGGIIDTPDEFLVVQGVFSYLVTTLLVTIPLLMMHRRRATMFAGAALVLGVAIRLMVINEFPQPHLTVAAGALAAALLADGLLVRLDTVRGRARRCGCPWRARSTPGWCARGSSWACTWRLGCGGRRRCGRGRSC